MQGAHVLLGASGSVAAVRVPRLARLLQAEGAEVRVVLTKAASHFVRTEESVPDGVEVLVESDEWGSWRALGDPVLHIDLRKWADVLVIAPLSANTMAKLANGLCDNLLTCVARAWPLSAGKPLFVVPAMNTAMWDHPATALHVETLGRFGIRIIPPITKKLACGDTGTGAMQEPAEIVSILSSFFTREKNASR